MPIDALSVLCAQLMRDLLAIAKFFFISSIDGTTNGQTRIVSHPKTVKSIRLLAVPEQVKIHTKIPSRKIANSRTSIYNHIFKVKPPVNSSPYFRDVTM